MGVAFHDHEVRHLDAAHFRHAPQVVSPQVHQHEVFRPLLGVLQQLVGQLPVFLLRFSSRAGSRDGAQGGHAVFQAHHGFGGGPHQQGIAQVQEEHVGGRVDVALSPVKHPGIGRGGAEEGLGDDCLDDVPGGDVFLDAAHAISEGVGGHFCLENVLPGGCDALLSWRPIEHRRHFFQGLPGFVVGLRGRFAVDVGVGREGEGVPDVIEDVEPLGHDEVRQQGVGRTGVGNGFEEGHGFIIEVPHHAPPEPGKPRKAHGFITGHDGSEYSHGIAPVGNALLVVTQANGDGVTVNPHIATGTGAEKAVTPPALTALDAFQEKYGPCAVVYFCQCGKRGFRIRQDFLADGDEVAAPGQFFHA